MPRSEFSLQRNCQFSLYGGEHDFHFLCSRPFISATHKEICSEISITSPGPHRRPTHPPPPARVINQSINSTFRRPGPPPAIYSNIHGGESARGPKRTGGWGMEDRRRDGGGGGGNRRKKLSKQSHFYGGTRGGRLT